MNQDPIVAEVRQAGRALAEQAGGDVHEFFEHLREAERQYSGQLVETPQETGKNPTRSRANRPAHP